MQNQKDLVNHLLKNGKTHSWRQLADMYNVMSDLPVTPRNNKKKCDYVRRLYSKLMINNKSTSLIDEFKLFVSKSRPQLNVKPFTSGNPDNILVIGDTHIPYHHPEYLQFCLDIQRKWNCGKVIHIGDLLDFNSTSFHPVNPNSLSPYFEMEIAKLEIENWKKAFPDMVVLMGNHDRRISRKLFDSQISSHWQISLKDVLNVNWEFLPDYEYNGIYFCHGEGTTARITCLQKQQPVVQGHRHGESYIDFPARNLFAIQVPIGIDRKQLAFEYAKADTKEWMIGATVILNSKTPIIERL